jgi:murein L,D-transpeptidase YafK
MRYIAIIFLILSVVACSNQSGNGKRVTVDKVVVYKSKRELQLIKSGKIVRTFKVALGDNPIGHKQQEGDERTPAGKYTLDWRNGKSAYHKSIHISYPNARDKANAKRLGISPGGSIMIHGMPRKLAWLGSAHKLIDWTNGCIAVSNEEMDEIWAMVKNGNAIEIYE